MGKVVHKPKNMTPAELQQEIITASRKIYSPKRLLQAVLKKRGLERLLFVGEYCWQAYIRRELKKDMKILKKDMKILKNL